MRLSRTRLNQLACEGLLRYSLCINPNGTGEILAPLPSDVIESVRIEETGQYTFIGALKECKYFAWADSNGKVAKETDLRAAAQYVNVESVPDSWTRPGPHLVSDQELVVRKTFAALGLEGEGAKFAICTQCNFPFNSAGTVMCGSCGSPAVLSLSDMNNAWNRANQEIVSAIAREKMSIFKRVRWSRKMGFRTHDPVRARATNRVGWQGIGRGQD